MCVLVAIAIYWENKRRVFVDTRGRSLVCAGFHSSPSLSYKYQARQSGFTRRFVRCLINSFIYTTLRISILMVYCVRRTQQLSTGRTDIEPILKSIPHVRVFLFSLFLPLPTQVSNTRSSIISWLGYTRTKSIYHINYTHR